MESWRNIEGYNNQYSVSNFGNVRNDRTNRKVKRKMLKDDYEYEYVTLRENSKYKEVKIYELIANAFVTNKNVMPYVCHDEEDKEWIANVRTEEGIIIELGVMGSEESAERVITLFNMLLDQ
jgi:hypothetical protein